MSLQKKDIVEDPEEAVHTREGKTFLRRGAASNDVEKPATPGCIVDIGTLERAWRELISVSRSRTVRMPRVVLERNARLRPEQALGVIKEFEQLQCVSVSPDGSRLTIVHEAKKPFSDPVIIPNQEPALPAIPQKRASVKRVQPQPKKKEEALEGITQDTLEASTELMLHAYLQERLPRLEALAEELSWFSKAGRAQLLKALAHRAQLKADARRS